MKQTKDQSHSIRLTVWITGALLTASLIFFVVGSYGGPVWTHWLAGLSCSGFLFMPLVLLVIRRDLVMVWINTSLNMITKRRFFTGGPLMGSSTTLEPSEWNKLKDGEKAFIAIIVLMFCVFGTVVLGQTLASVLAILSRPTP